MPFFLNRFASVHNVSAVAAPEPAADQIRFSFDLLYVPRPPKYWRIIIMAQVIAPAFRTLQTCHTDSCYFRFAACN